jgi:hypothetical protein
MQGQSLGSIEFGEVFYFAISNRASDGTALTFAPEYYDILDNATGDVILGDQILDTTTDRSLWRGSVDTRSQVTDQSTPFMPNRTYSIVIKEDITDNPLVEDPLIFFHYNFTITGAYSARIKRLLGLSGENLIIDLFSYDSGNNATSFRVRTFDTRENAAQATPGITDVPEVGEIGTYTVTQTYGVGRQLRQSSVNLIDSDLGDL